ncbi:MAG TPA: AAA family ATPase [Archangium sp.]|nr:AAA family ATPase [Archangium sp.]
MSIPAKLPPREAVDIGILTVIPSELDVTREALGAMQRVKAGPNDTIYWRGTVRSELRQCDYTVVLAGIGMAGNPGSAALATQMIERYSPSVVLLVGIAAGMRGKVRIGEVVLSERVVAYEQAALVAGRDGVRQVQHRPEISRVPHGLQQDVLNYRPHTGRLAETFAGILGRFPSPPRGQKKVWKEHVASSLTCHAQVTIASGEKLLRDPDKLREVRRDNHGRVEVGEMEAAGLVEACWLANVPWLVIRGISDFGDELKDDTFHGLASRAAAAVMADFIAHGLDLGEEHLAKVPPQCGSGPRQNPFIVGIPITREHGLFGRKREQGEILQAVGKGLPVQLLGGAKMGKSSLLHWVVRHLHGARPVAHIEPGGTLSPVKLVSEIARKVGRPEVAARLTHPSANSHEAAEQLHALGPLVLLIDEADKLATIGRDFDEGFFEMVRGRVENGALSWISASRFDLYELFERRGLTSRFLNSSERIWVAALDPDASRRLAAQGDPGHAERILSEAGGFAYGLQWLGDRLVRGTDDVAELCEKFRWEMAERVFSSWWEGLRPEEHAVLKACARQEIAPSKAAEEVRRHLRNLRDRGLLVKSGEHYQLAPGEAWREFVLHAR